MTTDLQKKRIAYQPPLPKILEYLSKLEMKSGEVPEVDERNAQIKKIFPNTYQHPFVYFHSVKKEKRRKPLVVGVVFSGGQASGGHNAISGLHDALKKLHPESRLIGFYDGPKGFLIDNHREITAESLQPYRNQGGFDFIGSGRDKIETEEQFRNAAKIASKHSLDGFVIIGGDDSNTNAAMLAEYFLTNTVACAVVGIPKTIDGDLKNEYVEISFGFDTATKTYAEAIGNIARDALSAKKCYFFVKLMGRSASHIALECALRTHPNYTLIGEEIAAESKTLRTVTNELADMICKRASQGKNYGVILIPEGLLEFIPECKGLISELNFLLAPDKPYRKKIEEAATDNEKIEYVSRQLSEGSLKCFESIPSQIQLQLMLERDAHGNVPVSQIETDRLLIQIVQEELKQRKASGRYSGSFNAQPLFYGYEGRSAFPTNFDCQYCYALGHVAALLIDSQASGYMCCVRYLYSKPTEEWDIMGVPIIPLMHMEERHGKVKPVIQKALVNLNDEPFLSFKKERDNWMIHDDFRYPGPIQFTS